MKDRVDGAEQRHGGTPQEPSEERSAASFVWLGKSYSSSKFTIELENGQALRIEPMVGERISVNLSNEASIRALLKFDNWSCGANTTVSSGAPLVGTSLKAGTATVSCELKPTGTPGGDVTLTLIITSVSIIG